MELLCIQTHSQKAVIAGQVYPLIRQKKSLCGCNFKIVDVGMVARYPIDRCGICNNITLGTGIWWFHEMLFIPIGTQDELENYKLSEPALK